MSRAAPPAPDYGRDRALWAGLIRDLHAAVAAEPKAPPAALAALALKADACWTPVAPFPRGLTCRVLARAAWAYARQTDATLRGRLGAMAIACAGMVDELLGETPATMAPKAAQPPFPVAPPLAPSRLPYAED